MNKLCLLVGFLLGLFADIANHYPWIKITFIIISILIAIIWICYMNLPIRQIEIFWNKILRK